MRDTADFDTADFDGWSCPLPLRDHDRVVIGHGGGGKLSTELIEHLFLAAFGTDPGAELCDAANRGWRCR